MRPQVHYSTVSEAITELRKKGYTIDFNLEENCLTCDNHRFDHEEFEITEVYRYEGNTDPADEATVYGVESHNGLKGILVAGDGPSMKPATLEMLKKLAWSH